VYIREISPAVGDVGSETWLAAEAMCYILVQHRSLLEGKEVLEVRRRRRHS
jgi:hypothetical protein